MRKNITSFVGMTMLSINHWMRKNRIYSLFSLMFSVMLIMSNAAPFMQVASATASSDQLETESDSETAPIKVTSACEPGPAYRIEKCITDVNCGGSKASVKKAGDIITYRITVTNTGDVDLTNVTVTDKLIETLTGPTKSKDADGVLDAGEIWTYTGSYTVTQEDIDTNGGCDGYIDNVAMVDCDQLEPKCDSARVLIEASTGDDSTGDDSTGDDSTGDDSTGDDSTGDDSTEGNPDYFIYKSIIGADEAGDSIVNKAGDIIEYQIMVKNEGSANLTGVSVSDPMITLTGPTGDDVDSGVLNPGETWKFFGNYTLTQDDINSNGGGDGFIENTAIVSCNEIPDESSSVQQLIVLSSADSDSSGDTRSAHHSNGGTGHARIISKPTKNVEVNETTWKETDTETQLGPDIKNFEQNTESAEADVEKEPEQESAGIPGFEIVYGAVGLLAAIFLYRRK
ncbi:PGF-CTERM sorting domain-containing protein [Methanosarcina sp. 2.H.A.1B.4]|uniref:DUF7507 domain-containing protein n=1 Tax=Methanosarcina sp. 2.H.A.1B.4 TaxID=1483600 RepID=UPI0009E58421|nr:PGF-CTERM sorting domain-containing protein [Methanosarcina sp. 2.H.A.1B.4]